MDAIGCAAALLCRHERAHPVHELRARGEPVPVALRQAADDVDRPCHVRLHAASSHLLKPGNACTRGKGKYGVGREGELSWLRCGLGLR